jgi:hypothetical protein
MIEDEQLLEHAQETGFRLCSKEGWVATDSIHDTWHNVFSATWDPNDSNKLFVCSQNGQLRILDISTGSSTEYHVLFRRFSPAFEGSAGDLGKPTDSHWDKMILVPNRPGEIIFLLGISKVIMYTAVPGFPHPYPSNPMIARTTRGDSSEFIYGTPILELSPHTCRVTALATSSNGHLFASGDEKGNMKISVLVRQRGKCLTSFTSERQSALKNTAQSRDFNYGEHGDSKVSLKPHGGPSGDSGPIFSIQWLPITIPVVSATLSSASSSTSSEMAPLCYYVATGSADRAVRVWKVLCCDVKGPSVSPFITLSTTFTNVLSMHSHLVLGGREQLRSDKGRENLYKTLSNMFSSDVIASILNSPNVRNRPGDPFETDSSTPSSTSISSSSREMMQARTVFREMEDNTYLDLSNASVYLAAGTNTGCAYIWKLSLAEFQTGVPYSTSTYDDGTKLHSLLQSSDHPIVQIALSSTHTQDPGSYPHTEVQCVFTVLNFKIFLIILRFLETIITVEKIGNYCDTLFLFSSTYLLASCTSHLSIYFIPQMTEGTVDLDSRPHRLVLATSDTQSCVRSHCATDSVPMPHTGSSSGSAGLYDTNGSSSSRGDGGSGRGGGGNVVSWGGKGDREEEIGVGPVTLCGESYYSAPVAACSFREVLTPVKMLRLFTKREEIITDLFSPQTGTNKVRNSPNAFNFFYKCPTRHLK